MYWIAIKRLIPEQSSKLSDYSGELFHCHLLATLLAAKTIAGF